MEGAKDAPNQQHCEMKSESCGVTNEQRRWANYKSTIWSYDFVQSLTSEFTDATYIEQVKKLKGEFIQILNQVSESSKPNIVETIMKLGLSNVLHKEIKDALDSIFYNLNNHVTSEKDLRYIALCFRLLRHHGYNVSQDIFVDLIGEMCTDLKKTPDSKIDFEGVFELYEASHLAIDGEEIMVKAKEYSYEYLINNYLEMDINLAKQVSYASENPCHRKVLWFDVRQQIQMYEAEDSTNLILLRLAKLNFNIIQAMHQEELKEVSRWWDNLGLKENISFARDRLVESFLWTVGVACEPQHKLLRKCLTKVVAFVLVLDDIYDLYGSLEELECFTKLVERWDDDKIEELPECMKICFKALVTTTNEIAHDIQKEKGWRDIIPLLKMALTDFCKELLVEAWRQKKKDIIPTLQDYLSWAWITSSVPLISLISLLCTFHGNSEELQDKWEDNQDLIYYTSLIVRLLNDQGTSNAELERGETHSSMVCYMAETNATEEKARAHMKNIIGNTWRKINMKLIGGNGELQMFVNHVINIARVCHFIYQKGDGFSAQQGDTKTKIKLLFIEPLTILI